MSVFLLTTKCLAADAAPFRILAENTALGGLYLLILFGVCFGAVIGAKLLARCRKKDEPSAPPSPADRGKERTKTIYYIVEKKRTQPKAAYKNPRQIRFEEKDRDTQSS